MTFRHLRNVRAFFSDYYLGSVFGRKSGRASRRRLSDRVTDLAYVRFRRIRERAEGRAADPAACRERFLRPLLRDVLGFHLGEGEGRLHPLFVSAEAESSGQSPILMVYCGGWDENLDSGRGSSQPMNAVQTALARTNLRHGLLITGERVRLIRAAGEGVRGAYLEVDLDGLEDDEDPDSFAVFHRIFSASTFLPDANGLVLIDEVERESRLHAQKVSDDLKKAVFAAAESLVSGLIDDAVARGQVASALDLSESDIKLYRDAALTGLYRILFILYAEARDPRLDSHQLYRDSYSAQGLLDEVVADSSADWPNNRCTLWHRLRALFRIYDEALPAITTWENIPPRGGDFFSARTPEGNLLDQARLPDRVVARLMLDLATATPRRGVGRERVSFRELDIENLGAVYEGLLEHEPKLARQTALEVKVQGRLYALTPAELVRLCNQKQLALRGDISIVAGTEAESLHPDAPTNDELDDEEVESATSDEPDDQTEADDTDDQDEKGVRKGAPALLLRRIEPGAFHFVPGPSRKGTGSFYTPRPLVRDLVHHALGPVVVGKGPAEIERLRVLDPACGSAHFLVEAMRFLGQTLHRAYVEQYGKREPPAFRSTTGRGWDDDWMTSDEDARGANSEARAWCKRRIAEHCLFGVDLNPTAVTLARVALWIESVAGDRPLSYFEHHVRPGNSLLGTWMDRLETPPLKSLSRRASADQGGLFQKIVRHAITQAARVRRIIDDATPDDLRKEGIDPESVEEQEFKEHLRRKADKRVTAAKLLFDLRSASAFVPEIWSEWHVLCSKMGAAEDLAAYAAGRPWWKAFELVQERESFFHWEMEFPEVFLDPEKAGFDAVIGNPPWDKVLPARKDFYARYDVLIRPFSGNDLDRRISELHGANANIADEFEAYRARTRTIARVLRQGGDFPYSEARSGAAHEDVSKYFLDRAAQLVRQGGRVGMVAPSMMYNGDGWVGFRRFLLRDATIERFYGFENRRKIFPIDSRYKFVSLVFRKGPPESDTFDAALMRHDLEELDATAHFREASLDAVSPGAAPWVVRIPRSEFERFSPETLGFLEYRGPRDQAIALAMQEGQPTLGRETSGTWSAKFITDLAHLQIYNSSRDKDLWTDPLSGRLFSPNWILSHQPNEFDQTLLDMRSRGFWPVFEGKHIEQFLIGIKPVRWWLSVEQAERKYGRSPRTESLLVFRKTARNTDERTCIGAILPPCSAATEKLTGLVPQNVKIEKALVVLNSLPFDWLLRLRAGGTDVSQTYVRPMRVPRAPVVNALPILASRIAGASATKHITEEQETWPDLWAVNRAVAEAYGLGPADFSHILAAFPVFVRKRPKFVAYIRERLLEWSEQAPSSGFEYTSVERTEQERRVAAEREPEEYKVRREPRA